ncbi:hypothetical protein EVAR_33609_1 [Eumeta japonica]|uniref:Uncharacterized protein n=1 Tax=Eumeta variegata TaxID=151549 RepID=A0A4C1WBM9_EUMVA|nr:hypothetical protein EVAR_33609_1 [Eumeta japonica]
MSIGLYLDRMRGATSTHEAVSWGTERKHARGVDLCNFFNVSVVDVSVCRSALLDRAEAGGQKVTSSDLNADTFAVRLGGRSGPLSPSDTRVYSTAKAPWLEFETAMDAALSEQGLIVEMVKSLSSYDQLNDVVETYTECFRQASDAAIPRKSSERKLKLPWWNPQLLSRWSTWSGTTCEPKRFTKGQQPRRRLLVGSDLLCTGRGKPLGCHV